MKPTPRDLLLARHAPAQAELDALRRAALPAGRVALRDLWRELFWARRAAWSAIAVAWLAILAGNFSQPNAAPAAGPRDRAAVLLAWQANQAQLDALFAEDRSHP